VIFDLSVLGEVTAVRPRARCVGIRRWVPLNRRSPLFAKKAILCGKPATVDVGYPACDRHGARSLARLLRTEIARRSNRGG
jgi:hypothetical protein